MSDFSLKYFRLPTFEVYFIWALVLLTALSVLLQFKDANNLRNQISINYK